jgi:hypothetical protein
MLNEEIFEDAFTLHDPTNHYLHLLEIIQFSKTIKNVQISNNSTTGGESKNDEDDSLPVHRHTLENYDSI